MQATIDGKDGTFNLVLKMPVPESKTKDTLMFDKHKDFLRLYQKEAVKFSEAEGNMDQIVAVAKEGVKQLYSEYVAKHVKFFMK